MPRDSQADPVIGLLLWGGFGVAVFILAAGGLVWLRRRLLGDHASGPGDVLDLETLRQLKEAGTITEQEYKALRRVVVRSLDRTFGNGSQR